MNDVGDLPNDDEDVQLAGSALEAGGTQGFNPNNFSNNTHGRASSTPLDVTPVDISYPGSSSLIIPILLEPISCVICIIS